MLLNRARTIPLTSNTKPPKNLARSSSRLGSELLSVSHLLWISDWWGNWRMEFMWNEWVSNSWTDTPWCLLGYAHFEQLFIRPPSPLEQNQCFAVQSDFPDLFDMWRLIMSRSFRRFCRQLPWKPIMLLTLYGRMSYGLMVTSLKHVQWLIGELLFSQSAPWVE